MLKLRTLFVGYVNLVVISLVTSAIGNGRNDYLDQLTLRRQRRQTTLLPRKELQSEFMYPPFTHHQDQAQTTSPKNVDDNHKPTLHCDDYRPEVKEEQARGEFVIQVNATNIDERDKGGLVTYSIVQRDGDRSYFNIDNRTGIITTAATFDRDEPFRQKEIYVTVQAIDNGRPPLADVCTFKVTILDINDNAPTFDTQVYDERVSEDLKEDREVMRVFAYDSDDGNNSLLTYSFIPDPGSNSEEYFRIDNSTGVIYLKKSLAGATDRIFNTRVMVKDNGNPPLDSTAEIKIRVVGSEKQPPSFISYPKEPIVLKENFSNYEEAIATLSAESNIPDKALQFELVKGKTTQTNRDITFKLTPSDTEAIITLARALDYETVTAYKLTVRVTNKDSLAASVTFEIKVEDVNDEIPTFIDLLSGSVVENEPPGAPAMTVRAIDKDGTSANNIVNYNLTNYQDLFEIDRVTGVIKALGTFDREVEDVYVVKVKAYDNSPSAILKSKSEPNSAVQAFRISIKDRNDNKPEFTRSVYIVHNISESADKGKDVTEVKANDKDTASLITYSITDGNIGNAFYMEEATGRIKVNVQLDYETIESYNLTVRAYDGIYDDFATVIIRILNENDEPPKFNDYHPNITDIEEESLPDRCIIMLKAVDPDIKNPNANQSIIYRVADAHMDFLNVTDEDGQACVRLIKPLDRDQPYGSPKYQGLIYAFDNGGQTPLKSHAEINIYLIDINDNPPFLVDHLRSVVWNENQQPGDIIRLAADDYDSQENGPPFTYRIAPDASLDIQDKFSIKGTDTLYAKVYFDREEQKYYDVPIAITDSGSPPQTGISYIRVIIGDLNDNPAQDNSFSEIFIYSYQGAQRSNVVIGRVYVEDPDDWDINDKYFQWSDLGNANFILNEDTGNITMKAETPEGNYTLRFVVEEDPKTGEFPAHKVRAVVNVTVKGIPEEAVRKSGSIRLEGITIEEFVEKSEKTHLSKKDLLQRHLASILNTSIDNVDVFTVLVTPSNNSLVDVRFSAHGSPYYAPEKLNSKVDLSKSELEMALGVQFVMISISECLEEENTCPPQSSCSNRLVATGDPAVVFTNKTSFVGIKAVVEAVCDCLSPTEVGCLNGGLSVVGATDTCNCADVDADGPHCEKLAISFYGEGWAMYPTFNACNDSEIILEVTASRENGLIFYAGPMSYDPLPVNRDFMSLQLENGYPVLLLNYGKGTTRIELKYRQLTDDASHSIRILFSTKEIQISIDDCHKSDCQQLGDPIGNYSLLNVNGPLQLGGTRNSLDQIGNLLSWEHMPSPFGFAGCIRNFTYNGYTYDLGNPSESKNAYPDCNYGVAKAVSFGIDSKFLVAILVCIAILLILLLAVVVHRRKQDNWNEKEIDESRETIIDYQLEGGGEYDTQFDMNVLRCEDEEKPPIKEQRPYVVPADISGFLDTKKDTCDRDPNNLPYDDVRHYAYEGDGNSTGSLSSLASCTDEGDLKFNYLSSFGPRFRKLADMYGEDPSDDDSQDGGEESWC